MRFLWHCWQPGRALLATLQSQLGKRGWKNNLGAHQFDKVGWLVGCGGEDACRAPNPAAEAFCLRHSLLLCSCSRRSCSVYTTQLCTLLNLRQILVSHLVLASLTGLPACWDALPHRCMHPRLIRSILHTMGLNILLLHTNTMQLERFLTLDLLAGIPLS